MAKRPKAAALSEAGVLACLRKKFPAPEYVVLGSVRNATGFSSGVTRTADALAMGIWPSRGLFLHGFEIKSDRRDWLREKADPAKADEIAKFCDFWWLAAGGEDIVEPDELPPNWGLLVPDGKGSMRTVRGASGVGDPARVTRAFLAAIVRRAAEDGPGPAELAAAVSAARDEERKRWLDRQDEMRRAAEEPLKQLQRAVREFEAASGVKIDTWQSYELGNVGRIVAMLRNGAVLASRERLTNLGREARRIADDIAEVMAELDKMPGASAPGAQAAAP